MPKKPVYGLAKTLETGGFILREGVSNRFRRNRRPRLIGEGRLHASWVHITPAPDFSRRLRLGESGRKFWDPRRNRHALSLPGRNRMAVLHSNGARI